MAVKGKNGLIYNIDNIMGACKAAYETIRTLRRQQAYLDRMAEFDMAKQENRDAAFSAVMAILGDDAEQARVQLSIFLEHEPEQDIFIKAASYTLGVDDPDDKMETVKLGIEITGLDEFKELTATLKALSEGATL